jgi:hypothetical protein
MTLPSHGLVHSPLRQGAAFGKCESQAGNASILPFYDGDDH